MMLSITEHIIQTDKLVALRAYLIMITLTVIAFILLQVLDLNEPLFFAINEASKDLLSDAVAAHLTELGNGWV
jgi:hypothetical protein